MQGGTRVGLLDVGVERVVHHPAIRMVDLAHEGRRILGAVHQVHLEAVQVLDDDRHVASRRVLGGGAQALDRPVSLLARRPRAAEEAERCLERSAERVGAERGTGVDGRLGGREAAGPHLGVRTDRAVVLRAGADSEGREPELLEAPAEPAVLLDLVVEDRDLDTLVADLAEQLEGRVVFGPGHVGRPEQHVHAELRLPVRGCHADDPNRSARLHSRR